MSQTPLTPGTTITNPDELDAAPVGVVVRDIDGDLWARNSHPGRRGWTGLTPGCAEATSDDLTDDGPLVVASVPGALDVEEMVETLVPVVYAQNQTHYEDSEGFMHVKPWEWLTPEFQESIRAEAREYVGYLRAAILGGAS